MQTWRLNERETRKYEAAERLGLTGRLLEGGWPGLSAKEAGRIGGALRGRKRQAAPPLPENDGSKQDTHVHEFCGSIRSAHGRCEL